ncbi:MAG: ABC transporter ATP-binding protein/permease [Defluviitaleaceae bacterium]|nr:ABC transporter ATP-binding protein/permease [Defluviitaleaceae bacterium]
METVKTKTEKSRYNLFQNSGFMISLAWKYSKGAIFFAIGIALCVILISLIGLFITPTILEIIQTGESLSNLIYIIIAFSGGLILLNASRSYFEVNVLLTRIYVRGRLSVIILEKYLRVSFPSTESQDMLKKMEKAADTVSGTASSGEAIWITLTDLLTHILGFIIYFILLISINPIVLAVILITCTVGFLINKHLSGWGYRHREEEAEYLKRMNYVNYKAVDRVSAKDIRIFGMRDWIESVHNSAFALYNSFVEKREKVYIWSNIVDLLLAFLRNGIAYIYLIGMVLNDGLSAPEFLLLFSAIGGFTTWITQIMQGFTTLHRQSLDISAVRELLEYPEEFLFDKGEKIEPIPNKSYELELRNVTFRYPEATKDTLLKINLKIKPGEKLAIVGLNGAGKTTLVKILCGLYDPTEGEVLLNGENIKKYNREDYYKHFSAVFQDFSVFASSIADNITQMYENVDKERMEMSARKAGIINKINSLDNNFDTKIGKEIYKDGIELSGGELQRLMLARAIYKDAPILVLDEPTAALDPIAESEMYNQYNELTEGRTSIYISHRLASTRFCDRIILMENNVISEEGTHEELLANGKSYKYLFDIQSKYYREGATEHE